MADVKDVVISIDEVNQFTKCCIPELSDRESKLKIIQIQKMCGVWQLKYNEYQGLILLEKQKLESVKNDNTLDNKTVTDRAITSLNEIDRLENLVKEHNKQCPLDALDRLNLNQYIRDQNNLNSHLPCLERWCETKPFCCCGYWNCKRKNIIKWTFATVGGVLATTIFMMIPLMALSDK